MQDIKWDMGGIRIFVWNSKYKYSDIFEEQASLNWNGRKWKKYWLSI